MSKQLSMIIFTVSFISGVYNETTNEIITGGVGNITVSPFLKFYCFSLQQLLAWTCMMLIYLSECQTTHQCYLILFFFLFDTFLFIYLFISVLELQIWGKVSTSAESFVSECFDCHCNVCLPILYLLTSSSLRNLFMS